MRRAAREERTRGVALALVLATFAVTITTCVALARMAASESLRRRMAHWSAVATDVAHAVDAPLAHWLNRNSSRVSLPPDATFPRVLVLHEILPGGENLAPELTITAWDQCGLLPWRELATGSPLRPQVPAAVLEQLDGVAVTNDTVLGLDLFSPFGETHGTSPFPAKIGAERDGAVGAYVATHNEDSLLNVNTAPISLIDVTLRALGRGGLDQIVQARSLGQPAVVGGASQRSPRPGERVPTLVAVSNAWAFRIDVRVGGVSRSWWCVYRDEGSGWRCVERLAITT